MSIAFASVEARPATDLLSIEPVAPGDIIKLAPNERDGLQEKGNPGDKAIYLIRLKDAPVASYRGNVSGLRATSPEVTGAQKFDSKSPAARAYKQYLVDRHADLQRGMTQLIGRSPQVAYEYFNGNNGMAVWLTADEAAEVRQLPGVIFMQRDLERELHTDAGPAWVGAPPIWAGLSGLSATEGEGVIVGIIDTGINPSNPSFAAVGPVDAYQHSNPWGGGVYVGVCDPTDPTYDATFPCNDKLIGARGYPTVNGGDPRDNNSHGSHTASTSAGNRVDITVDAPTLSVPASISGVAPHANIVAYSACCTLSALTAGIDDAIADGVDVINYSIGSTSPSSVWSDFDTMGYLTARTAGIFVATSAGNAGPGPETVGSPADAPWLISVGNSTHDRAFENELINMAGGGSPPADMLGQSITSGFGPAPIIHAAALGDAQCLNPFPAATCTGQIVVCDRGTIARVTKGINVAACGAGGFVLANTAAEGESVVGDPHVIPAVHVGVADGDILRGWLSSGAGHVAEIDGTLKVNDPIYGDVMRGSSSRGANRAVPDIIKPDVTAPGVNILAVVGIGDPSPPEWDFMSGTSMASPHVAGAAALFKNLYPGWTPAEVQSAFTSTGRLAVRKEDAVTPADPFDMGGGSLAANTAAGVSLVLNETEANYLAANPATGGDPKSLNLATLGNAVCPGSCSWTRTVRSVAAVTVDVVASVRQPAAGWNVSVTPSNFTLTPGATQVVTVAASATSVPTANWAFGGVTLTPSTGPVQDFPVALAFDAPAGAGGSYSMTNSVTDPACDTGFGGYVDLESFGVFPASGITGDTGAWSAFSSQDPVEFYGVPNIGISFTDDGFAYFGSTPGSTPWAPQFLPDPADPNSVAAPLWADHNIVYDPTPGSVKGVSLATAGANVSVIEYDDVEPFGSPGVSVGDFEIVVYSAIDNTPGVPEIVFAYSNPGTLPGTATIGVEAPAAADAVTYLNQDDPAGLPDGLMVCFDYQAGCQDYWTLDTGSVITAETYNARKGVMAGDSFGVGALGNVAFNTAAGGFVQIYPGFSVADTGVLSIDTNAPVCP